MTYELIIHNYLNAKAWTIMSHWHMYSSGYILKFYHASTRLYIPLGLLDRGHVHTGQFDWDCCFITVMSGNNGEHWEYREISLQGSWGQHAAHLGPAGPRWAPCWPHELCYLGYKCCALCHALFCTTLCGLVTSYGDIDLDKLWLR